MKKTLIICLALVGLFAIQFASHAEADTTFVCTYAGDTTITYTVIGAAPGANFVSTWTFYGRIAAAESFTRTADTLVAPTDVTDSLFIQCTGEGRGKVWIFFSSTLGAKVDSCELCFNNDALKNVRQVPCYAGPTMTEWGVIVFAGLFILTLIFVLRKRAKVPTPA